MSHIRLATFAFSFAIPGLFGQNPPQPDNSAVNQQDREKSSVTADQQKQGLTDRTLTQQIRKALVEDKSLSNYAHNVKIVAQNGVVTLRGQYVRKKRDAAWKPRQLRLLGATASKAKSALHPNSFNFK